MKRSSLRGHIQWAGLLAVLILGGQTNVGEAQVRSRAVPKEDYFAYFDIYYDGDYSRSVRAFRDAARGGIRSTEGRWIDSICYHTMIGECLYHMGELSDAIEQYNSALTLALAHQDWMTRIDWPPNVQPLNRTPRYQPTWGVSTRRSPLARIPDRLSSLQGQSDASNLEALRRGGVVQQQFLMSVGAKEIVRCTALALRRRTEIMGPVVKHDPLTNRLADAFSRRPTPANHWSQSWVSLLLGLSLSAQDKAAEATRELQRSLTVAGRFDHEMTAVALLEMGKIAFRQKNYPAAATYFFEATFPAAAFSQFDVLNEAFTWGAITHMASGKEGLYPPLTNAAAWAKRVRREPLEAGVLLSAAENQVELGNAKDATALIERARRAIGRRDMRRGNIGARLNFVNAQANSLVGKVPTGLSESMAYQKRSGRRLFQISLANQLFKKGSVSQRVADLMFEEVLREPSADDWAAEPMESLSLLLTDQRIPMENWFELAMVRKEEDKALLIADRARRSRFFSTLPMGGRVLALRWILDAPQQTLSEAAVLQRQSILNTHPNYRNLSREVAAAKEQLRTIPLNPSESDQQRRQTELYKRISELSAQQETLLRKIALSRRYCELAFPPLHSVNEVQQKLEDGESALVFFATSRGVYAFLIGKTQYSGWKVESPQKVQMIVAKMLRSMGNLEKNFTLGAKELANEGWKEASGDFFEAIGGGARNATWSAASKLTIVPDHVIWYVPFEALMVGSGADARPMISQTRIRYLPTMGMLAAAPHPAPPLARNLVVAGKLFPRDDEQVALDAVGDLRAAHPDLEIATTRLPAPSSLVSVAYDRLVVLSDIDLKKEGPYDWSPMLIDGNKPTGGLGAWMSLPFGAPTEVVLPGFHSQAENGLKKPGDGRELFLTTCAFMASGTQSILISRWRVGGGSAYDLMREFVQELPHMPADEAWQRSVQLFQDMDIDGEREPRIRVAEGQDVIKGSHPFFWAGYMVVGRDQRE